VHNPAESRSLRRRNRVPRRSPHYRVISGCMHQCSGCGRRRGFWVHFPDDVMLTSPASLFVIDCAQLSADVLGRKEMTDSRVGRIRPNQARDFQYRDSVRNNKSKQDAAYTFGFPYAADDISF